MAFSSFTDALASILRNTGRSIAAFNPSALLGLAGRGYAGFNEMMNATGAGTMRDAKRDLDTSLKVICEDLMTQASLMVASPLGAFLSRSRAFLAQAETASASGANPASADLASMERGLREFLEKLRLFLSDEGDEHAAEAAKGDDAMDDATNAPPSSSSNSTGDKAVNVLVPPTLSEILEHYTTFYNLVRQEYPFEISGKLTHPARVGERLRGIAGNASAGWTKGREG
jgi:hypothetical protein